ncbi:MAG TPA: hypothetical protein VHJ20_24330 [Polyangia bacterium]|nr:hypothetical protein [Polyangia bacterium]
MDVGRLQRASAKTLLLVQTRTPGTDFEAWSPGLPINSMAAIVIANRAGKSILDEHDVIDPTPELTQQIGEAFAQLHGLVAATYIEPPIVTPWLARSMITVPPRPPRPVRDLYLEVARDEWKVFTSFAGPGVVRYQVSIKLIAGDTKAVLAEGTCNANEKEQVDTGRSYGELLADDAAIVKFRLASGAARCASFLASQILLAPLPVTRSVDPSR